MKARGFWRRGQTAFFDVRITHVNAQSHRNLATDQVLKNAEQEKKRAYNVVENRTFTPLVFGTNGEMGDVTGLKLSNNRYENYSSTMNWTRLNFSIIRSTLLCLRGTRVHFYAPVTQYFEFAFAEANMLNYH